MRRGLVVVWEDPVCGYAAKMLGALGFDVIAVRSVGNDLWDNSEASGDGQTASLRYWYFHHTSQCVLSADAEAGRLAELLGEADVFIESWADPERAAWEQQGIAEASVWRSNPRLVWASITPYGRGLSPSRRRTSTLFAESGFMSVSGPADGAPCVAPGAMAYDMAGAHAVVGILALLEPAERGHGGLLDLSILESLAVCEHVISRASHEGRPIPRTGSQHEAAAPGRVFAVQDGFVHLMIAPSSPGHWEKFRDWFGDPRLEQAPFLTASSRREHADELSAIVGERLKTMTRQDVFTAAQTLGLPMVPVHALGEFVHSPHEASRLGYAVDPVDGTWPRLPEWSQTVHDAGRVCHRQGKPPAAAGPLGGLTILDFSHILSGPYATLLLGYLGATVIKVESPAQPDGYRLRHGQSNVEASRPFADFNRNKKGVAVDLKDPRQRERLLGWLPACDVLVENFRDGTLDRLGIDWPTVQRAHPAMSLIRIRGVGRGPWSGLTAYGPTIQALCGLTALWNPRSGMTEPVGTQGSFADYAGGIHAAMAILAAARAARWDGVGREIEISMADAILTLLGPFVAHELDGQPTAAMGNWDPYAGEIHVLPTADGRHVCLPELVYQANPGLWNGTAADVLTQATRESVEVGMVQNGLDLLQDARLARRGFLVSVDHPHLGRVVFPGCPMQCSDWHVPMERAPYLGEHDAWADDWFSTH